VRERESEREESQDLARTQGSGQVKGEWSVIAWTAARDTAAPVAM
jgi:hypothetical protein